MTYPVIFSLGSFQLPAHLIFDVLAYTIGFLLFRKSLKRTSDLLPVSSRQIIIVAAIGGAFFGSHLIGLLESSESYTDPRNWFHSKTIVGGLAGGLLSVEMIKKIIGERQSSGDLFTFPIILGMIIGRIGCFLTGVTDQTTGLPTSLPWGIYQGDSLPRHPTSLYEILFLVILAFFLYRSKPMLSTQPGLRFKYFMLTYMIFRFMVEFIKPVQNFLYEFSAIQVTAAVTFVYYGFIILRPISLHQLRTAHDI